VIGVVVSRADEASKHVGDRLLDRRDWTERVDDARPEGEGGGTVYRSGPFELRTFDELPLRLDGVASAFSDAALVAFASRHSGETGPLLSAHFTGNFGPAEYGGADGELATAAPAALEVAVAALEDHAPEGYEVGVECTHHGPSEVGAPSLFAELGSDEPQWTDPDGARAVAAAILSLEGLVDGGDESPGDGAVDPLDARTVVGFGGGHYAPRFERVLRETDWTVGHVAADWALAAMGDPAESRATIRQAFERSGAEHALLDGDRPDLAAVVADLGYRVVGETWLREVDGVPQGLATAVEDALGPVEDGTRFGERAERDPPADVAVVPLPDDLLDEAWGVDAERTRAAVAATTLAYRTVEGGTRPRGRAAVGRERARDELIDRLVDLLDAEYESVRRREGVVEIRERSFDPDRARELGVPPGPKFGALADGEPVEGTDGTVDPAAVTVERTRRVSTE
jgi:D-aminoacyl-tRNA deacylase